MNLKVLLMFWVLITYFKITDENLYHNNPVVKFVVVNSKVE